MSNDEDPPSSPASSVRAPTSARRSSKRKQVDPCSDIDDTMDRVRRNSLQLATLDCVDAPVLQPASKSRRAVVKRGKVVEAGDKEVSLPHLSPQVTMTFDELNGLIKRKGMELLVYGWGWGQSSTRVACSFPINLNQPDLL